jgi:hypothetical protein
MVAQDPLSTPTVNVPAAAAPDPQGGVEELPGSSVSDRAKWLEDPAWSLERLWAEGSKPRRWIVEPLIAQGDQIILAGEPKCGKSLLASQLCIEIAAAGTPKRSDVLQISRPDASKEKKDESGRLPAGLFKVRPAGDDNNTRWTVLYVSFEMDKTVMWARSSQQAEGLAVLLLDDIPLSTPGELAPPDYVRGVHKSALRYYHLFELEGRRTLGLFPKYRELSAAHTKENLETRLAWFNLVDSIKPDLIIFDSLSQLHFCDENSNLEMRDALQQLRDLCTIGKWEPKGEEKVRRVIRRVAHIVIHHTRKEGGDRKGYRKDAAEMRGASSIHSEADLAMTITKRQASGSEISVNFSSRHSSNLPDLRLERDDRFATYRGQLPPESTDLAIARRLFGLLDGMKPLPLDAVMARYRRKHPNHKQAAENGRAAWEKLFRKLSNDGLLSKTGGKRGKGPLRFSLRKGVDFKKWIRISESLFVKKAGVSRKVGKSS